MDSATEAGVDEEVAERRVDRRPAAPAAVSASRPSRPLLFTCIGGSCTSAVCLALQRRGYERVMDSGSAFFHFQFSILSRLAAVKRQQSAERQHQQRPSAASCSLYAAPVPSRLPHAVHCHLAGSGPSLTSKAGLTRTLSREQRWIAVDADDFYPRSVELRTAEGEDDGEEVEEPKEEEEKDAGGEQATPADLQRAARRRSGGVKRGNGGRRLRAGERELLRLYRWQTAVCLMKRAVISSQQQQRDDDGEAAGLLDAALQGGRDWLRHLQRGGRWQRRQQPVQAAAKETEHGVDASDGLQGKDWDNLVRCFERMRDEKWQDDARAQQGGAEAEESKEKLSLQSAASAASACEVAADPFCSPHHSFSPLCSASCPFLLPPLASMSAPVAVLACLHALSHADPQFAMSGLDNLWICKPGGLSRGRGIAVLSSLSALRQHCAETAAAAAGRQLVSFICQRYIERPLLLSGHKFDIRLWALVRTTADLPPAAGAPHSSSSQHSPLRRCVYAYNDLYARLASVPYSRQSRSSYVHLTNHSVQAEHPAFASTFSSGNQLSLSQLSAAIASEHPALPAVPSLLPGMHRIVLSTVQAAEQSSLSSPCLAYDDGRERYALLGFDFMLDEAADVWLLECNSSPTLCGIGVPGLVERMLDELMQLLCEGMEQRVRGGAAGGSGRPHELRQTVGGWQLLDSCDLIHRSGVDLTIRGQTIGKAAKRSGEECRRPSSIGK